MNDEYEKARKEDYDNRIKRVSRAYRKAGNEDEKARRAKFPKKYRARMAVARALKMGRLVKPDTCEECGKITASRQLHGHHDDYDKLLDVRWLCRPCHDEWHLHNEAINGEEEMGMLDRFEKFADKTFNDACALYLSEFEGKCRRRQEYALTPIQEYVGELPLIDVDDQALAEYKKARRDQVMIGTVNKELTTATAVLRKAAHVWRWIPSAPKLQKLKGDTRKPYPLSWQEQVDVVGRICGDVQLMCLFAVNTGVRREEIFKLRWADERDIDGVKLFILRDTKNGQDRPVILNSIARRVVDYMRDPLVDPVYVFPKQPINKTFNEAWDLAGLPDEKLVKKGIHNLRHTFGYRLRQAGVPAEDRDALLGHHSRSLTQHYAVPDIKRLAELAERVTERNDTAVLR